MGAPVPQGFPVHHHSEKFLDLWECQVLNVTAGNSGLVQAVGAAELQGTGLYTADGAHGAQESGICPQHGGSQ